MNIKLASNEHTRNVLSCLPVSTNPFLLLTCIPQLLLFLGEQLLTTMSFGSGLPLTYVSFQASQPTLSYSFQDISVPFTIKDKLLHNCFAFDSFFRSSSKLFRGTSPFPYLLLLFNRSVLSNDKRSFVHATDVECKALTLCIIIFYGCGQYPILQLIVYLDHESERVQ